MVREFDYYSEGLNWVQIPADYRALALSAKSLFISAYIPTVVYSA